MRVKVGTTVEYITTFEQQDVEKFAELTQDNNPIHLDEEYAAKSIFRQRVVHGMLVSSMFSKIFGTIFPGEGGIYLGQSLKFLKPVFIGQTIKAVVTLISFDEGKNRGVLKTEAFNEVNELVITGEAKILFPK